MKELIMLLLALLLYLVSLPCDCGKPCAELTCAGAMYQLFYCGCAQRDSDHDGIPCESVCLP